MKAKEKRQVLINMINSDFYLNDELIHILYNLLNDQYITKGTLMKLVYNDKELNNIDSAIPIDHQREVEKILPCFNSMYMVYDYNQNRIFGEFQNVAEKLISKIAELKKF